MNIRTERPDDYEAVYSLVEQAFASAEHSDGTEQDLVAALPEGERRLCQNFRWLQK